MKPDITIFSKAYCPYCDRAKNLLTQLGLTFTEKRIDQNSEAHEEFQRVTNQARTVPQILINGKLIGGFDNLSEYHASGELDQFIK